MSKLSDSLKKYNSTIKVADITTHLEKVKKDLDKKYLPMFKDLSKDFKNTQFKGEVGVFVTNIFKDANPAWKENPIVILNETLIKIDKQLVWLEAYFDTMKTPTLLRDALDYKTATILQLINYHSQVLEYSRMIAIVLIDEQMHLLDNAHEVPKHYRKTILTGAPTIASLAKFCERSLNKRKDLEKIVYDLPEIIVTDDSEMVIKSNFGGTAYDILGLDAIFSIPLKIAFFVTRSISEVRMYHLDIAKEELELLEMKRQEYALALQGKSDARLEKIIEHYDEEIETKRYKLRALEEKVG